MDENGVLVSSNFKEKYGYKIGDTISYQIIMVLEGVSLKAL